MGDEIKITAKGQITIPKKIRMELALKTGEYLQAEVENGKIILRPKRNDETILMKYAHIEGEKSIGLAKVREMTKDLNIGLGEYVRKTREEEADADC